MQCMMGCMFDDNIYYVGRSYGDLPTYYVPPYVTSDASMRILPHEQRTPVHYVASAAPRFVAHGRLFPNKTVPEW
jgi:hypothetical protein